MNGSRSPVVWQSEPWQVLSTTSRTLGQVARADVPLAPPHEIMPLPPAPESTEPGQAANGTSKARTRSDFTKNDTRNFIHLDPDSEDKNRCYARSSVYSPGFSITEAFVPPSAKYCVLSYLPNFVT